MQWNNQSRKKIAIKWFYFTIVLEFREKKEWYISLLFVNSRATIIYNVVWVISMNWIYIIYDLCLNAIRRY